MTAYETETPKPTTLMKVSCFFREMSELGYFDKLAEDFSPDQLNQLVDEVREAALAELPEEKEE